MRDDQARIRREIDDWHAANESYMEAVTCILELSQYEGRLLTLSGGDLWWDRLIVHLPESRSGEIVYIEPVTSAPWLHLAGRR